MPSTILKVKGFTVNIAKRSLREGRRGEAMNTVERGKRIVWVKLRASTQGFTTRNKKLLGAPGITTRSKDATRGSWPYY